VYRLYNCIAGEHEPALVILAVLICACTVGSALKTFALAIAYAERRAGWLVFTGLSAAAGIWTTHFVAMLAYNSPVPVGYDLPLTVTSLLVAGVGTTAGFWLAAGGSRPMPHLGGAVIGLGIAGMHFCGMLAISLPGQITWEPWAVAFSILTGTALSTAAIVVFRDGRQRGRFWLSCVLLVAAIAGLHFTAMSAVTVVPDPTIEVTSSSLDRVLLAMGIAALTAFGLGGGIAAATIDGLRNRIAGQVVILEAEVEERRRIEQEVTSKQAVLLSHQNAIADLMKNEEIRSGSLEQAMRCLLKALARGLAVERAGAVLLDAGRDRIIYRDIHLASTGGFDAPGNYGTPEHVALLKQTSGKWIVAVEDTSKPNPLDDYNEISFVPSGIRAALQAPVIANGELVGFLTAASTAGPVVWSAEQRLFALSLSNIAALVVERHQRLVLEAQARSRAERLARQQSLLNDLMNSQAIRSGALGGVLGDITAALCREMSIDRVSVRLFADEGESDEHVLTEVYVALEDRVVSVPRNGKRRYPEILSRMLKQGPIAVADCATDPLTAGFYANDLEPRRIRAMLHVPVYNGGEIVGVVQCSTYDTPREWLPEDLLLATGVANLVALATERRLRLRIEETLRQANLVAEEANKAKSLFLANMSHEIRTPMNGVLGMTDLLIRSGLTERQLRLAGTIGESARALLTIINDILDLSRIEGGKLELDPHEVDLGVCVEDAAELLAEQAHKKGLDLNLFIDEAVAGKVTADQVRLRQILVNLIANAIKFTPKGEVSVDVGPADEGMSGVRFCVRDTGIGIDPQVQSKLFQPFAQADTSITRRFGGTGLGLSISRHLVEMMGGKMEMRSAAGQGTSIAFTLPLEVRAAVAADRNRAANLGGRRLIVVDDNATNREIISSYLASCGAVVEAADSADVGIDRLQAAMWCGIPFDLAIVDYKMAGCNGLEFARRVRSNPSLTCTRMMMLSSMSWDGDAGEARASGFSMLLHKPIRRQELIAMASDCISSSGTDGVGPAATNTPAAVSPALGLRILVAEDNPVNQVVAEEYLSNLGCTVVIVENGAQAVEAAARQNFDVLLMDCQMPEMDGYAATRAIRARESVAASSALPIIAITANAFETDRERCLASGMNGYLSKPYSEAQLAAAIAPYARAAVGEPAARKTAPDSGQASSSGPHCDSSVRASYLKRAPRLAAALAKAVGGGDAAALSQAARRLEKVSAKAGEDEITALASAAGEKARAGDLAGAGQRALRIAVLVAALAEAAGEARESISQRPMRRA
jgi:signal transduction histidine kinase/CheY-like chemotaxis protein/NO-binding membrane sensor protein with MHYT domain